MLLPDHDPSDFDRAMDAARGQRFALVVLYRCPPGARPVPMEPYEVAESAFPGD